MSYNVKFPDDFWSEEYTKDSLLSSYQFKSLQEYQQADVLRCITRLRQGQATMIHGVIIYRHFDVTVEYACPLGHYDSRTCRNGGGYWQFTGAVRIREVIITIQDTSCGDFGSRRKYTITKSNKTVVVEYDTMGGDGWYGLSYLSEVASWVNTNVLQDALYAVSAVAWEAR